MYRCLQLASLGAGNVAPNPMVGAVLIYDDRIIGEGFHRYYGNAHAEVNCINSVTEENKIFIEKSTLYVSLEPCAHFGKTPPCSDLIIKNKIPNVVIGCTDTYKAVNGKGIERLKAAGVQVTVGVLEKESIELNKRFSIFNLKQRPYIILKWAQSSDAKIAGKDVERILISNKFTSRLVHQWRSEESAIMVGTTTAIKDNPALTTRFYPGKNPVRLVIDMDLKLPVSLKLFDETVKTIVFNLKKHEEGESISFYKINKKEKALPEILDILFSLQIQSVIIEGGTTLLQSFINENLWDEARVITNMDLKITDGINAPVLDNKILVREEMLYTDKIEYFIKNKLQ